MANVEHRHQAIASPNSQAGRSEEQDSCLYSSEDIARELADRLRMRRKDLHLSQSELALSSGVSLGSLKRFEHDALISLDSLIRICGALGCQAELTMLFAAPQEDRAQRSASIQEIVAESHRLLDQISSIA